MSRVCTICSHPERLAIEEQLQNGTTYRNIAERYQCSLSTLTLHRTKHIKALGQETKRTLASSSSDTRTMKRPSGQHFPDTARNEVKAAYLEAYARHGIVARACRDVGINRSLIHQWEEHDAAFSVLYSQAKEDVNDLYREEARRRALDGVESYVVSQGKIIYVEDEQKRLVPLTERKYSDALIQFIMKAKMPEYREKSEIEHSGNLAVQVTSTDAVRVLANDVMTRLQRERQGRISYEDDLGPT